MMKCLMCGGEVIVRRGLETHSKMLGPILVPGVEVEVCTICGEELLSAVAAESVHSFVMQAEREAINRLPVGDFVSSQEATKILGISRQALNKHRRIQRGFVYFTNFDGKKVYYKPSLIEFKNSGDGRIPLLVKPEPPREGFFFSSLGTQDVPEPSGGPVPRNPTVDSTPDAVVSLRRVLVQTH